MFVVATLCNNCRYYHISFNSEAWDIVGVAHGSSQMGLPLTEN